MSSTGPSIEKIKEGMRAAWMAGDFGVVAKTIAGGAEEFVNRLKIAAGAKVLDVACGTGNLAIPLARKGMAVTGVDIATNLLVQARERAAEGDLKVQFDEGDAEQLPYAEGTFDAVVTMFGAMFAPRPEVVASELARVLRRGGMLAMANWTPGGFTGKMFRVGGKHVQPPTGLAPPVLWGDDATVRQRLAGGFPKIQTTVIEVEFDLPMNPAGAVAFFRKNFGPTQVAFSKLDESGQAEFASDLEALWSGANIAQNPEDHTVIRNEYLQVVATRG
jgi:SAM-dependent methyltransferase